MPNKKFIKTLERDSTLVIQALFSLMMKEDLPKEYGIRIPYNPMIIHYVTADNIQIWENEAGVQWLLDRLFVENKKGTAFIASVISEHNKVLPKIQAFWNGEPLSDLHAVEEFLALLRKGMRGVAICFYTGLDERTPEDVQKLVVDMRKDDEIFSRGNSFLKACLQKMGVEDKLAHLVLTEEVSKIPSREELRKRAQGVVLLDGGEMMLETLIAFTKSHPEFEFTDLVTDDTSNVTVQEIKGQIACKGKARGVARVIKNARHIDMVKEGDILVSPMTTPDLLPAMKVAGAFITDEGGIVCHAAVIAREMNKPCIIGTKIATQVLKDGDMVEVDADNGVVRVVERAHTKVD